MTGLKLHSEPLKDEWLDAYGHLNEAFYLVPFSNANWAAQEHFGIGAAYFEQTGGALYTLEAHVRYVREVRAPAPPTVGMLEVESLVLGAAPEAAPKKLWWAHRLLVDGAERATWEGLLLHYDSRAGRAAPLPAAVCGRLRAARTAAPEWAGRRVGLENAR